MTQSLVVINPHACAGTALRVWKSIESDFIRLFGVPRVAITNSASEIPQHLSAAVSDGIQTVFSVGGDGTNHTIINGLIRHNRARPDKMLSYGSIPAGTGQDWARGLGMPLKARDALEWLSKATPQPIDTGCITYDGMEHYFLNIASAGISHDVILRVERYKKRPAAFFLGSIGAILSYQPEYVRVRLDGQPWFEGRLFLIVVANGKYFGQGMKAAPDSQPDDGLLDVLIVPDMPRLKLLTILPTVYNGSHIHNPAILFRQAAQVEIHAGGQLMGIDLDGEPTAGHDMTLTLQQSLLKVLRH